ncbi:MAG: DEAD/DEAH box helicase [Myxococcota bacterium]
MTEPAHPHADAEATFGSLGLSAKLLRTLDRLGYEAPTPVQAATLPLLLEGRDLLGSAATGTGKTAAFALPMVEGLAPKAKGVQALVVTPTRELAIQVAQAIHSYGKHRRVTVLPVYGGQAIGHQLGALRRGVQVVVGTPGRLLDHVRRGSLDLAGVRYVVLDEADEMLDMGFIEDIETILDETPAQRQTALFSATFPPRLERLAKRHLRDPERVEVQRTAERAPNVRQVAFVVHRSDKLRALGRILDAEAPDAAIIFCRRRVEVDDLTEALSGRGYRPQALHGGVSQQQRDRVMKRFRDGGADLLVATDVAARGLDIDHVTHVINYDIPQSPETYVHRVGRTGRAGREGKAFTLVQPRERRLLNSMERVMRQPIEAGRVPTIDDLRARRRETLREGIRGLLESGEHEAWREMVASLAEEFDPLDVAAAAAHLASDALHGDEPEDTSEIRQPGPRPDKAGRKPSRGDGPPPPKGKRRGDDVPMTRLFVGIGGRKGVRPGDLVGAIAGETGIPGGAIGAIDIQGNYSIVDVPETMAEHVMRLMSGARVKGAHVRVEPYRPRPDRPRRT